MTGDQWTDLGMAAVGAAAVCLGLGGYWQCAVAAAVGVACVVVAERVS